MFTNICVVFVTSFSNSDIKENGKGDFFIFYVVLNITNVAPYLQYYSVVLIVTGVSPNT